MDRVNFKKEPIVSVVALSSSACSKTSEHKEKLSATERTDTETVTDNSTALHPAKASVFAKGKELFAFAGGCLVTYAKDAPLRHDAVSKEGDFAHYIVQPWYDWFGRNKRVTTSRALNTITLQSSHGQPERPIINGGGFNYAGVYGMPVEYESLHRKCLDTLPIPGAAAPLVEAALEQAVVAFWSAGCCFTTPTGYQSNILAFTAILDDDWFVLMDQKSHSSMSTAAYLSNAGGRKKFKHNDMHDLKRLLDEIEGQCPNIMVAVEGLYSLDGDIPDLAALYALKTRYNFVLCCDEAHSFLSLGTTGRGCLEWWNDMHPENTVPTDLIDIRTTTLSKAVGGIGGLVCAAERFYPALHSRAIALRSTGESLATPNMLQALWVLRQPERLTPSLARLRAITEYCHERLERAGVFVYGERTSPVLPIHAGRPTKASELSHVLRKQGVAATPFSKPAVPMWQSRVRIGMSAEFTDENVEQLVDALIGSCAVTGLVRPRRTGPACSTEPSKGPPFQWQVDDTGLLKERDDALRYLDRLIEAQRTQLAVPGIDDRRRGGHTSRLSPRSVIDAGHRTRGQYGLGSGSSRWILGTYPPHLEVEKIVCNITGQTASMVYTNTEGGLMSTVAALCRPVKGCPKHVLLVHKAAQQPILDGHRAAPRDCKTEKVVWNDLNDLTSILQSISDGKIQRKSYITLVLTLPPTTPCNHNTTLEALFTRLLTFRRKLHGLTIFLDCSSPSSFPSSEPFSAKLPLPQALHYLATELRARILIFGSFYQTFGLNGAFLAGDGALIDELRYTSRFYVFAAAPPPFMMGMVADALGGEC
ncbi:hypothetical protein B0A54_00302 [Friedmanniomyces endolithicus]|uniref:serine C-palmitoyltransferase n=1 Tax=Friedmanniomyces endolithicus TaxID=329885 RepID=A0A4U0VK85_9PEZI|nr:hypothetical protein B0A54_00302 [Friedmanniomyces endolithicus]